MINVPQSVFKELGLNEEDLGDYPLYKLIKESEKMEKQNQISNEIVNVRKKMINFSVPICIDKNLKQNKSISEKNQIKLFSPNSEILKFCEKNKSSCTAPDVINALETKKLISHNDKTAFFQELFKKQEFPKELQHLLGIKLAKGRWTQEKSGSYVKLFYPVGVPKSTKRDSKTAEIVNDYWISVYQKTANSRSKVIMQTSAEIEQAEDLMAKADVEISLNEQARRTLYENGISGAIVDPVFQHELEAAFNRTGWLIIKLTSINQDAVTAFLEDKLYTRGFGLCMKFIKERKSLIHEHEKSFPSTRAMYKTKAKLFSDYSCFSEIQSPIKFPVENLTYASQIIDIFVKTRDNSNEYMKASMQKIIKELRSVEYSPDEAISKCHVEFLASTAIFCTITSDVREIDIQQSRVKIPKEIGISDNEALCPTRVFNAVIDLIENRKGKLKERFADLAGLFPIVDVTRVSMLVKSTILLLSTCENFSRTTNKVSCDYAVTVKNGELSILAHKNSAPVSLDLSKVKFPDIFNQSK